MTALPETTPAVGAEAPASATRWQRLSRRLTFGFIEDRYGKRRQVHWFSFAILGLALPALAVFTIYQMIVAAVEVASFSVSGIYHMLTAYASPGLWLFTLGMYMFTNLGISIYYHRGLTHRGLAYKLGTEIVLSFAAGMAIQGPAWDWVPDHRNHHTHADVVGKDPHSPWEYPGWRGLLWAQWVWLFYKVNRAPRDRLPRDVVDNKVIVWQQRYGFAIQAVLTFALPLPFFGWHGVLVAGVLRLAFHMMVTGFINSVCHWRGTRAKDSKGREYVSDDSRNNIPVAILSMGEGNHAGHHAEPKSPRHGWTAELDAESIEAGVEPDKRWKPDASWRVIQLLAWMRLLTIVKDPPKEIYFNDRDVAPKKQLRAIHEEDAPISRVARRALKCDQQRELATANRPD